MLLSTFNMCKAINQALPGDGFYRQMPFNMLADWKTAAGLVLTAATAPLVAALETSFIGVQSASSTTDLGMFNIPIPRDYDDDADELKIRFLCNSAGTTNAPTITAAIYRKREGVALTADLGVPASAAIVKTSATIGAGWVEINASKRLGGAAPDSGGTDNRTATGDDSIKAGDRLTVALTISAHATDAINFYGVEIWYRSNLAFTDKDLRAG